MVGVRDLLRLRREIKRRKPIYVRQQYGHFIKLSRVVKWRKPRGIHSKILKRKKGHRRMPEVGYGSPKLVRGLNKEGFKEVMVMKVSDLDKVGKGSVAVIGSTVGKKKRIDILKEAIKRGIVVNNYKDMKKELERLEKKKEKSKVKEEKSKESKDIKKKKASKKDAKKEASISSGKKNKEVKEK